MSSSEGILGLFRGSPEGPGIWFSFCFSLRRWGINLVAIHCMSTLSLKMLFTDPSEISNMLATLQRFFYFQVQVPLLNPHFDLCCFLMDILGVPVPSEIRGIWKTTQNLFSTYCLLSKSSF